MMHPEVKAIVSVSDAQRNELNRGMARLLERLLAESCREQTQDAAKYAVADSMTEVTKYLDKTKLEALAPVGK
jgi:hypothetical protein